VQLPDGRAFTFSAWVIDDRPVTVIFEAAAIRYVAAQAGALGTRVLLISGAHEAAAAQTVGDALGHNLVGWIPKAVQHVPLEVAAAAIETARDTSADVLVAVGGGSAIGLAKAVARELALPIVAVPTTYAGSEMTPIWGQTKAGVKKTGRDFRVLPRTVVYDPELTVSMPRALTAASGMNALAHALESLYAPDATPTSSAVAEAAIRDLTDGLRASVANPEDIDARSTALRGAWLAGWALGSTTMGLHHKLAHVLGGTYALPHAEVHSVLLPQVAAFNSAAARPAFERAAEALRVDSPDVVGAALFDLGTELGAPLALADLGLARDVLDSVAVSVSASAGSNPRSCVASDLRELLQRAWTGVRPGTTG
jgi:maleylacetate reductase